MRRILSTLALILILCGGIHAMIQTLSLTDLVAGSDLIVLASLKRSAETGKTPEGLSTIENILVVAEVLKGGVKPGAELTVTTLGGFEDEVVFAPRQKGVLFLKKAGEDRYEVNNLVQGWWPLGRDDAPTGMGTGITLDEVKEAVKAVAEGRVPPPASPSEPIGF